MYEARIKESILSICNATTNIVTDALQIQSMMINMESKSPDANNQQLLDYIAKRIAVRESIRHWEYNHDILRACIGRRIGVDASEHRIAIANAHGYNTDFEMYFGGSHCTICKYSKLYKQHLPCVACPGTMYEVGCNFAGSAWSKFVNALDLSARSVVSTRPDLRYGTITLDLIKAAQQMVAWLGGVEQCLINDVPDGYKDIINNMFSIGD